jgi:predicted amidophosphoribosyltransferase
MLVRALVDLVLPVACGGCAGHRGPGRPLCPACDAELAGSARPVAPLPRPAGFPPCWAVAAYGGAVRSVLLAYKERGRADLRRPLGAALAVAVRAGPVGAGPVLLVPVPSRPDAIRQRGADTTLRLASAAAAALCRSGLPARAVPALRLCRSTVDAAGLSAGARAANLAGAMAARERGLRATGQARLVVVDDLVTTGVTLAEAVRALAGAGHPASAAAVIAATGRRTPVGIAARPY